MRRVEHHSYTMLEGGQWVRDVHNPGFCRGGVCAIHNRSDHHMRSWPQNFRNDLGIMERICSHGVGHPDPDDYNLRLGHDDAGVHSCEGCCSRTVIEGELVNRRELEA